MKFTKTAFRKAFKEADQTLLWKLTYLKLGHTPTKGDVHKLIGEVVNPKSQKMMNIAWTIAYSSFRKNRLEYIDAIHWNNRDAYRQYDIHYYRAEALKMLRSLHTELHVTHTQRGGYPPIYTYDKVCRYLLNVLLATDKDGNRYDLQAAWCSKVLDLLNCIYYK